MTAAPSIDPARFLRDELAQASPDLMRELLTRFVNALLSAQADEVCGAEYGARDPERVNRRNRYRHRDLDTRVGTLDVAVQMARDDAGRSSEGVVLLSPACASYDQYNNYEQRGDHFRALVETLPGFVSSRKGA